MPSTVNSTSVFQDLRYQTISFDSVIAVRSNVFLCDEICPCSSLFFREMINRFVLQSFTKRKLATV